MKNEAKIPVLDLTAASFCLVAGFALPLYDDGSGFAPFIVWPCAIFCGFYGAFRIMQQCLINIMLQGKK